MLEQLQFPYQTKFTHRLRSKSLNVYGTSVYWHMNRSDIQTNMEFCQFYKSPSFWLFFFFRTSSTRREREKKFRENLEEKMIICLQLIHCAMSGAAVYFSFHLAFFNSERFFSIIRVQIKRIFIYSIVFGKRKEIEISFLICMQNYHCRVLCVYVPEK